MWGFWCFLFFLALANADHTGSQLDTIHEWKYIDYTWQSDAHRELAIDCGEYNYTKCNVIDVDRWKDGRIFVTVIRDDGVPASLNTVSRKSGDGGPLLSPYPNWRMADYSNCDSIINVYRVAIDRCDRMWVLDNGKVGEKQTCPPKLLAFNLRTDELIEKIPIPLNVAENPKTKKTLLVTPVVQTYGRWCSRTYVYMADVEGFGLVVYSSETKKVWRVESPLFEPDPNYTKFTISGQSFSLEDGILGMALSPRYSEDDRRLYFKPLASLDIDSVPVKDIQKDCGDLRYHRTRNILPSQGTAFAFSETGTLFFGLSSETAIGCWNQFKPLHKENIEILEEDSEKLQFASGVKVIPITGKGEELWIATNRLQKIFTGTQDFSQVNFRVMRGTVSSMLAGTKCQPPEGKDLMSQPTADDDPNPYDVDENQRKDGSHENQSKDGSHENQSKDGSHENQSKDGSHENQSKDGSHENQSKDGSHENQSKDGSHEKHSKEGGSHEKHSKEGGSHEKHSKEGGSHEKHSKEGSHEKH